MTTFSATNDKGIPLWREVIEERKTQTRRPCPVSSWIFSWVVGQRRLRRSFIGCDLNPDYIKIANERLRVPFEKHYLDQDDTIDDLPLFSQALPMEER